MFIFIYRLFIIYAKVISKAADSNLVNTFIE